MKQPICSRCKRPLKDPFSIAVGMGPECRGGLSRKGWKFPKPKWQVRGGKTYFMGVTGKIEPPTPTVSKADISTKNEERVFRGGREQRKQGTGET